MSQYFFAAIFLLCCFLTFSILTAQYNIKVLLGNLGLDGTEYSAFKNPHLLPDCQLDNLPEKLTFTDRCYLTPDNQLYIVDMVDMKHGRILWKKNNNWVVVADQVHIVKTFGARAPLIPTRYLGNHMLSYSEFVQDSFRDEWYTLGGTAKYRTILIDCLSNKEISRSKEVYYEYTPKIFIPYRWYQAGIISH